VYQAQRWRLQQEFGWSQFEKVDDKYVDPSTAAPHAASAMMSRVHTRG